MIFLALLDILEQLLKIQLFAAQVECIAKTTEPGEEYEIGKYRYWCGHFEDI